MGCLSGYPHTATVHDVGEDEGQPYIVSECMVGADVEALIAGSDHHLDLDRAIGITDRMAKALEHTHAHGVVHRDLKPGNIWLAEGGIAKLGDFGLAFAASDADDDRGHDAGHRGLHASGTSDGRCGDGTVGSLFTGLRAV